MKALQTLRSLSQAQGAVMVNAEDLRELLTELQVRQARIDLLESEIDRLQYMADNYDEFPEEEWPT
jgi:hypothetical protein